MKGRTRITSRLPTRVTVETRTTWRAAAGFAGRRQAVALVQAGGLVVGAERAAQRAFDALRHFGKGHFAVERRKNGAADEGCAAQAGQNRAAEPLHRDAAAIDHRGFGAIDGKRRLVAEIDRSRSRVHSCPRVSPCGSNRSPPNRPSPIRRSLASRIRRCAARKLPRSRIGAWRATRHRQLRDSEARTADRNLTNVDGAQTLEMFSAVAGTGDGFVEDRRLRTDRSTDPAAATGIQAILRLSYSRERLQDCGSSTADAPEISGLLGLGGFRGAMRQFADDRR